MAHLDAFGGVEGGATFKVNGDAAADGDARRDLHVGMYRIGARAQCCRCACDGVGIIIVVAAEQDAVLVGLYHAVVLQEAADSRRDLG